MAERQVPGGAFLVETATKERQVPGYAFVNETLATATIVGPLVATGGGSGHLMFQGPLVGGRLALA